MAKQKSKRKLLAICAFAGLIALGVLFQEREEVARPVQDASATQPAKLPAEDLLGPQATADAFANYVGSIQGILELHAMVGQMHLSKMRQAMQWGKLDEFRSEAEKMRENAQNAQQHLSELRHPVNMAEADSAPFDIVNESAGDLAGAIVTMAVDVSVNANTGIDMMGEMDKDSREAQSARARFESSVMTGYKHFGLAPNQIDMHSLRPKEPARRPPMGN
jgi:hypothetical protein